MRAPNRDLADNADPATLPLPHRAARPIDGKIGARLRASREASGFGLEQVAAHTGLSPAVLNSSETGIRPIGAATLFLLAGFLKRPVGAFFSDPPAIPTAATDDEVTREFLDAMLRLRDPRLRARIAALVRHLARAKQAT